MEHTERPMACNSRRWRRKRGKAGEDFDDEPHEEDADDEEAEDEMILPGSGRTSDMNSDDDARIWKKFWDIYKDDDWLDEKNEIEWETKKGAPYVIFMHKISDTKRNICIIPTVDGGARCSLSKGMIDDDCFDMDRNSDDPADKKNTIYSSIKNTRFNLWNDDQHTCLPGGG